MIKPVEHLVTIGEVTATNALVVGDARKDQQMRSVSTTPLHPHKCTSSLPFSQFF